MKRRCISRPAVDVDVGVGVGRGVGAPPPQDSPDFLYSPNLWDVATRHGWWAPEQGPLNFMETYGVARLHPAYVWRRVWRVFSVANPDAGLPPDTGPFATDYPFSIQVRWWRGGGECGGEGEVMVMVRVRVVSAVVSAVVRVGRPSPLLAPCLCRRKRPLSP